VSDTFISSSPNSHNVEYTNELMRWRDKSSNTNWNYSRKKYSIL